MFDFLLGGRVNPDRQREAADLSQLDNVRFVGPVVDGKAFLDSLDVGIIPFTEDGIGDAINPVKMYTYLERGLPVVATNIAECRSFHEDVMAAPDADRFVDSLVHAVSAEVAGRWSDRRQFALGHTWDSRATTAIERLTSVGLVA
jgi:hypothetical protein